MFRLVLNTNFEFLVSKKLIFFQVSVSKKNYLSVFLLHLLILKTDKK